MPEIAVNVEVYCEGCGAGLCGQTTFATTFRRSEPSLRVEPCEACLDKAWDEGHGAGYDQGVADATEDSDG